ncbi:uncharacterized protein EV420DRAFT_1473999 [Desarmillaria tabescens]|uniref:Uncharacterized protein n=1 Tax=Armillaria tabescens TaxID=1929756 RepID=A0AA39NMI7_ARMTA|nr:uncharacterized protein EV420DRAFT_1473999 [Desarmillaria tabescens]KAK0468305.1 hypothetical protein EV420DRAFT_1473999 [Desarmillaria tabescens]
MSDHEDLLKLLNGHGQDFLKSFSLPSSKEFTKKRKRTPEVEPEDSDEYEEWSGIGGQSDRDQDSTDEEGEDSFEQEDDDFTAESSSFSPNVVVFSEASTSKLKDSDYVVKSQKKAFMSSKISKLKDEVRGEIKKSEEEEEEDRTNAQNDALLHRLVHTKLLSGSLNPDLDMKPAQRKKALAGRILELNGDAKLGRGEKSVRQAERNKASKRIRAGLLEKEKQRQKAQLEEACFDSLFQHRIPTDLYSG